MTRHADTFFHVAQLHGSQIVIDDDQRNVLQLGFGANFFEFASADERGGIERIADLQHGAGDIGSGAFGELCKFLQRIASGSGRLTQAAARRFFQSDADEQDAFAGVDGLGSLHRVRRNSGDGGVGSVGVISFLIIRRKVGLQMAGA